MGYRLARSTSGCPEPANPGSSGAFLVACERSSFPQRSAADGRAAAPVAGLSPQPESGTLQGFDSKPGYPPLTHSSIGLEALALAAGASLREPLQSLLLIN